MNQKSSPGGTGKNPLHSLAAPPALHRWLLPLAGMALVAGAVLLWLGWREGSANRLEAAVIEQRDQVVLALATYLEQQRERFTAVTADPAVAQALDEGDADAAVAAISRQWPELEGIESFAPDLELQLEREPAEVRFGRLALLQQALAGGATVSKVIRLDTGPVFGLAARATHESRVVGVVLAHLPLSELAGILATYTPDGTYLAVKQGRSLLVAHGAEKLAALAEIRSAPVADSGWRVVAASPPPAALPLPSVPLMLVGALLLALAAIGTVLARRPARVADPAEQGETFADALKDLPPTPAPAARAKAPTVPIEREIFRAYDVRGIVGKNLDASVARFLGMAIGSLMHEQGLKQIVVGRDGRHSGQMLSAGLIEGLRATGRDVIDIGQATTPLVYFAGFYLRTGCGVSVTGSHNPPDYNGFKIVVGGETLYGEAIQALYGRIAEDRLHTADSPGTLQHESVEGPYIQRVSDDIQIERRLKVVVDCGNGVAGALAPATLEAIGCEVVPLYCEVDGDFPNHHPDPSEPANLSDLIQMVERLGADLGIALDGDGDRLGVVTGKGKIIYPDRVLMLFAQDVLSRNPGACILYDVKCTGHLAGHVLRHGGSPVMWKTGHSLMKAKMRETAAELAGEMSGHFFFRERWYGFDDGIYAAARLLEILASVDASTDDTFATLPESVSTPELKVDVPEGAGPALVQRFQSAATFEGARLATIDGIRADWPDGWGLVRPSNTTPVLVMRFEADNSQALERIQTTFKTQLLAIAPELKLPF